MAELFIARRYVGVHGLDRDGELLDGARASALIVALLGAANADPHLASAARARSAQTFSSTVRHIVDPANYALWQFGPVARKIGEPIPATQPVLSHLSVVPHSDRGMKIQ